jgi:hypothetical protein
MKSHFGNCVRALIAIAGVLNSGAPLTAQSEGKLVDAVRAGVSAYRDPEAATEAGWLPATGCVSGPQEGAMGTHYINGDLMKDPELDPRLPEALIFEQNEGRTSLVGVEFITIAEEWHKTHTTPPVLLGQHFQYVGSPNRYGLKPFYELHVWAWKDNPNGTFADWHAHVSCRDVAGQ